MIGNQSGFKVCTIGARSVGKTALVHRYTSGVFSAAPLPTVESVLNCHSEFVNGKPVKLHIWDTAGQERFKSTVPIYLRDAQAILVVYDQTSPKSFEIARDWIENEIPSFEIKPILALVANKSDLQCDEVVEATARQWAEEAGASFFSTSAMNGKGVKDLFQHIARELAEKHPKEMDEQNMQSLSQKKSFCNC